MKRFFQNMLRNVRKSIMSYIGAIVIVALGLVILIYMYGIVFNLEYYSNEYYTETNFADAFASVTAMPESMLSEIGDIQGIDSVFGRFSTDAKVVRDDSDEIVIVHLLGYSPDDTMNKLLSPENMESVTPDSIYIAPKMSSIYKYEKGDTIQIAINGQTHNMTYSTTVSSPEYLFSCAPGSSGTIDEEHYDIGAVEETTLQKMAGRSGIVTDLGFKLTKGYTFEDVQGELEDALTPYGLQDLCSRSKQTCYDSLHMQIDEYRTVAVILSAIFISGAMFMLYIILKKLIDKDRPLIGTMKALGAFDRELLSVYMVQAVIIGLSSGFTGILLSIPVGSHLLEGDIDYYQIPYTGYINPVGIELIALLVAVLTTGLTVFFAVRDILKINPADSMRSAQPSVRGTFVLPDWVNRRLNLRQIIGLRSLFRNPSRSFVTIFAIALSFGLIATFMATRTTIGDSYINRYLDIETYDVNISLNDLESRNDLESSVGSLSYIDDTETSASYNVLFRNGNHSRYADMTALEDNSSMYHLTDQYGVSHHLNGTGLTLCKKLAERLNVKIGDTVEVENSEISSQPVTLPVSDIIEETSGMGSSSYIDIDYVAQAFNAPDVANVIYLKMDSSHVAELKKDLKGAMNISSVIENSKMRESNEENYAFVMNLMYVFCVFSVFLGVVMITSITNISVRERLNEFGTLMILGTTEREIQEIISFEHGLDFIAGILLGFPIAYALKTSVEFSLSTDSGDQMVSIPYYIYLVTFAICLVIMILSTMIVIRNIKRIAFNDVLNSRE